MASSIPMGCRWGLKLLQRRDPSRVVFTDLDDAVGRWHLQDHVPIVGMDHELL
jgi:hypothetical protein